LIYLENTVGSVQVAFRVRDEAIKDRGLGGTAALEAVKGYQAEQAIE
jgi:hypothetical protein